MYVILHRENSYSSWKAETRLLDCSEKAEAHCEARRDQTRGEQFRYTWIGDADSWKK